MVTEEKKTPEPPVGRGREEERGPGNILCSSAKTPVFTSATCCKCAFSIFKVHSEEGSLYCTRTTLYRQGISSSLRVPRSTSFSRRWGPVRASHAIRTAIPAATRDSGWRVLTNGTPVLRQYRIRLPSPTAPLFTNYAAPSAPDYCSWQDRRGLTHASYEPDVPATLVSS
jgi:hypothetical protein